MTRRQGNLGISLCAVLAITAAVAMPRAQGPSPGERIQNASCAGCHDLRVIQVQAFDLKGWTRVINEEIERGAEVAPEDIPVLAEYLALNHGPLPDAPGKDILLHKCTVCHDLRRVKLQAGDVEIWQDTLQAMFNEGAKLTNEEYPVLLEYLVTYFGEF